VTEFRILGPLEVVDSTGPIPLGGPKQRALLGLLLVHAGEVLSTDQIVDMLWSGQPPKTATTSLWNLVTQLRKVLPPDTLVTKPPGYRVEIDPDSLDLRRFEQLVARARRLEAAPRAELRLDALEERVDADLEQGAGAELVGELEALVGEHPLRERLRGQLMLALYRSGRQAEALQAYLDARRALVDELGIEPSPTLQRLYRSILRQESGLERAPAPQVADDHLSDVVSAVLAGRLVLVLGAGVDGPSENGQNGFAAPEEVVAHLASAFECPPEHGRDLARVAEYIALTKGIGPLYDELHQLFDRDGTPGRVHSGLALLEQSLAARGVPHQLVITTSFHELLEQAFRDADCGFDVVSYLAVGRHQGKFLHTSADGTAVVVDAPYAYTDVSLERRSVILKIHGGIDRRPSREWESFVVSEDDHLDHLTSADIAVALPVTLAARLRRSHFLFLGYPLREWCLRVFLHRVWGREKVAYRSWAIAPRPDAIEQELWRQRGIDILDVPIDDYIGRLASRLEAQVSE
jgi:DNA-binding SARP family transcriptional activator